MFWTVTAAGCVLLLLWQIIKPVPEPVDGVYRLPGRWYLLKKTIFKLLLKLNKRKNSKKRISDKEVYDNRGYGLGINNIQQLEKPQVLDKDHFAIDTVYFGAFNKDGYRLVTRVARRHNRTAEVWLLLEIPGIGRFRHPLHPDTLVCNVNGRKYEAGGLKIEMVEPMKRWKVLYNGQLRNYDTEKLHHVQFSLIWNTVTDPFNFDTDMNQSALADSVARELWSKEFWGKLRSSHQTHYEQWGQFRGHIQVEGHDVQYVTLRSIRDHSFGVRDWRSFHRYSIHFIFLEDGSMIQAGVVCSPGSLSHVKIGYLIHANGETHSLSDIDLKLWEVAPQGGPKNQYNFSFIAGNKTYHTEVFGDWTPVWYHHEDRGSKVYEKFCKYKINGIDGFGLVEFEYRNTDGEIYSPPESVPMLEEPEEEDVKGQACDLTLTFEDKGCCSSRLVGGKGAQLGLLTSIQDKVGYIVPKGFSVTLAAFNTQIQMNPEIEKSIDKIKHILRDGFHDDMFTACSDTVELIASVPVCQPIADDISNRLEKMFPDLNSSYLAVRSSAAGEDGVEASSAGQMETYLGIKGKNQVIDAVRKCWASAFTHQAVQYRRMNGQHIKVCVGVVIQEMVQSEVSGVLFTNNPINQTANEMILDASYGLGEAVVSGKAMPDCITLHRSWDNEIHILDKRIGEKAISMNVKDGGGLEEHETKDKDVCCMTDEQIIILCRKCIELENYFGSPRDIEWALCGDRFFFLQARPITTQEQDTDEDLLHEFDDPIVTGREFLTTGNIGEMMPGAVTPLTNSLFKPGLNSAIMKFAELMTDGPHVIHPANSVLSCCGTLFLNMTMLDIIAINNIIGKKEASELNMIGQSIDELPYKDVSDYCGGKKPFLRRLYVFLLSIIKAKKIVARCESWWERVKTYNIGEGQTTCEGLYREIDNKIPDYIETWENTIVKSGQSGTWGAVVAGILLQGKTEYTTEVCSDMALLLSKCDDVFSAEVPSAIQNLAKEIDKSGCGEIFLSSSHQECVKLLRSTEYPTVKTTFEKFIEDHGHRYVREAEFYERSWKAEPEKLVNSLKIVLKNKLYEQKPRKVLSSKEAISQIQTKLPWISRKILEIVLPIARRGVGQREWGKSLSIKVADKFKEAYWRLAELMVKEGRLPDKELLFFLTHTEIGQLIETRSPRLLCRSIRRKKLYPKQMELRFNKMNQGIPIPIIEEDFSSLRTATFSITGMPVCHGVVTGVCRVVKSLPEADSIQSGDILIVKYTDIGWSPYFPLISGLVTEIGGLISHGAVVAREFGLPCIVNVPNATDVFQSGDLVRLDGKGGTIERLKDS